MQASRRVTPRIFSPGSCRRGAKDGAGVESGARGCLGLGGTGLLNNVKSQKKREIQGLGTRIQEPQVI